MNLKNYVTYKKLLQLFTVELKKCNDKNDDHLIWVDFDGNIHIDCIPTQFRWREVIPERSVKYYLNVRHAGNNYVGVAASEDKFQTLESFLILVRAWQQNETGLVSAEDVLTKRDYEQISVVIQNQPKKQITTQGLTHHHDPVDVLSSPINNRMIQNHMAI